MNGIKGSCLPALGLQISSKGISFLNVVEGLFCSALNNCVEWLDKS
jgi:hypothetical protein